MLSRMLFGSLLAAGVYAIVGCSSIKSTHVMHNPRECSWQTQKLHGIPITVKVPSQLEVRVIETKFIQNHDKLFNDPETNREFKTYRVEMDVREKEEIYTVDFVRPAAGTSELDADIENQFFTKIKGKVIDTTIADINKAFQNVTGAIPKAPGSSTAFHTPNDTLNLVPIEQVVAVQLFEVHDPELEHKVQAFLAAKLNACWHLCPAAVPKQGTHKNGHDVLPNPTIPRIEVPTTSTNQDNKGPLGSIRRAEWPTIQPKANGPIVLTGHQP